MSNKDEIFNFLEQKFELELDDLTPEDQLDADQVIEFMRKPNRKKQDGYAE